MAELQRDPVSRGQFLTMGIVGSLVGAVLTIPPTVYLLSPTIQTNFQGRSDIPNEWVEAGSIWEIPSGAPIEYRVEFPQKQTYDAGQPGGEEEPKPEGIAPNVGTAINTVLVSWHDGKLPDIVEDNGGAKTLSASGVDGLSRRIYDVINHCAHLG